MKFLPKVVLLPKELLQSNPAYCIPHFRDNFTLRIRNPFTRRRTIQNIIKIKGLSLLHFKDTEIRRRNFPI